jgi:hypothetical protein
MLARALSVARASACARGARRARITPHYGIYRPRTGSSALMCTRASHVCVPRDLLPRLLALALGLGRQPRQRPLASC